MLLLTKTQLCLLCWPLSTTILTTAVDVDDVAKMLLSIKINLIPLLAEPNNFQMYVLVIYMSCHAAGQLFELPRKYVYQMYTIGIFYMMW